MELGEQRALGLAALSFWRMGQCSRNRLGVVATRPGILAACDSKLGAREQSIGMDSHHCAAAIFQVS